MKRLFVLLLLALVGCAAPVKPVPTVRYVNFKVYDPIYVAIEKGFFTKRGVNVEILGDVLGGPTAIQAVASGAADAGLSSVPALINANAAGLPVQGVVDVQTTLENQHLQRWFVRKDSPIQSLADVSGKTYAINLWKSSFHYTSLLALNHAGVKEADVNFVLLSFADQIPALINGEIDVAGLMVPYQGYLLQQYGDQVREIQNDYDLFGEKHISLIFVNRVWAEYNPDAALRFTLGIRDAIDWIEGNQEEAAAIIGRYTGIDASAVGEYHFTPHGNIRTKDVAFWLAYLRDRGDVTADWLTPEQVATNQYGGQ